LKRGLDGEYKMKKQFVFLSVLTKAALIVVFGLAVTGCDLFETTPDPTYSVSYDVNGGTGSVSSSVAYKAGEKVTVAPQGDLSRSGYEFAGWDTKSDGLGTHYEATDTFAMGNAAIILYAQWADSTLRCSVSGTISDGGDKSVLAGATVTLKRGSTTIQTGTSNGTGAYSLTNVVGGNYTLRVSKIEYTSQAIPVTLDGNKIKNVELVKNKNVIPVTFAGATETVNLAGLPFYKKIYLVTVNTNSTSVSAGNTGSASGNDIGLAGSEPQPTAFANSSRSLLDNRAVPPGHHPGAFAFNTNPPPITPDMLQNRDRSLSASEIPLAYVVGNTKNFWVESTFSNGPFVEKSATLRAQGTYCNVWVIENWGASVTTARAQTLAAIFDQIYPLETKILGYEYGGGPGAAVPGGKDGDPKIQILVYDFYGNSGGSGNTAGFYWSKDFYPQSELESQKTNLAEIFYISAKHLNDFPDSIYSTLVHEFQHMINFNVKNIQHSVNSGAWYNEMLSMMAEDMISPLIGIGPKNPGHPIIGRISHFLTSYHNEGVTLWQNGDDALDSYSYKYAFGAYLARNYGGAELVKNILANDSVDDASIVAALKQTTGDTSIDFTYTVEKFAEAFIFNDPEDGRATFNKTDTKTIGGTTYTFTGFDIWNNYFVDATHYYPWSGPDIYTLASHPTMQAYSVFLQRSTNWVTGTLSSVTLNRPLTTGVKLYLMIR
jgi:hypothetical protein